MKKPYPTRAELPSRLMYSYQTGDAGNFLSIEGILECDQRFEKRYPDIDRMLAILRVDGNGKPRLLEVVADSAFAGYNLTCPTLRVKYECHGSKQIEGTDILIPFETIEIFDPTGKSILKEDSHIRYLRRHPF